MDNLRGAIFMVLAMLGFAIEDMLIKLMATVLPVGQIVGMLGLGSAVVVGLVLSIQGQPLLSRSMLTPVIAIRSLGELIGTLGFVTAIALIPLSTASAILQATPLFVTLGAALFLGEAVGWRRWMAILVGFIGVLMIIRPGLEGFSWLSLFALQGVVGLGLRDLATRRVPPQTSTLQLSFLAFLVLIPAAAILVLINGTDLASPPAIHWLYFTIALLVGIVAYYGIIAAMRIGEVSFVTPFRYSRILFALIIGTVIFGERPDRLTLLGAAIVVASGLYTLWRERNVGANAR
ncbi:DMT family transporter [Roseobacter sinensis]|uniref:DMT family transporter n=1 Tax=Roseobacter sinensis TaxID=2931391 RepID=A0ABT3BFI0_9RHOB|nr:DMT family transporter [Roseobacter sp. WL0113]MCV3272322.1 DMT family transporter [Roseobacter sp. WL0113]